MNDPISVNSKELQDLLLFSFRYSIDRDTTAAMDVSDLLVKYWDVICGAYQRQIQRDITRHKERAAAALNPFHSCYQEGWKHVQALETKEES